MDCQAETIRTSTPSLSYEKELFLRTEDSGYHTSFTPSSSECLELTNENVDPSSVQRTKGISGIFIVDYGPPPFRFGKKYGNSKYSDIIECKEPLSESPINRRGIKRSYQEDAEEFICTNTIPTPTSLIAGGIQKLNVSDYKENRSFTALKYDPLEHCSVSYPTTPIKRRCTNGCKLSLPRKSIKMIDHVIHSLSCNIMNPQALVKHNSPVPKTTLFLPDQKVDIIQMLYNQNNLVVLGSIMSFLSTKDSYNFSLVNKTWNKVSREIREANFKVIQFQLDYYHTKENQGNICKDIGPKNDAVNQMRSMREIHNIIERQSSKVIRTPISPRTIRFKKFTDTAKMDSRVQLSCAKCGLPSKVTKEKSGEEWAECTGSMCLYQFCRFCKWERHTGKKCHQYDLEGPSPSKRKKTYAVGSKKSKRNLFRL